VASQKPSTKINGGTIKAVKVDGQPRIVTESANNTLEYWSVDNFDIEELPHKVLSGIKLDRTAPAGSVTISQGASFTRSSSVTLSLSATDATSGLAQMRFSNDNTTWSSWEAYAASKLWTLPAGDGVKTITVQYKDNAGLISLSYSDSIILDTIRNDNIDRNIRYTD
jgi:hypothetical protein